MLLKPWFSNAGPPAPGAVTPPVLGDFSAYAISAVKYENIPWGPASWSEITQGGATRSQVCNLWLPAGSPPPGGWPTITWFHANGANHTIADGSSMHTNVVAPLLAAGYAFVSFEFRHPVVNKDAIGSTYLEAYDDPGKALQFTRSIAPAFSLNASRVGTLGQSRGSLAYYATFSPDLANPYGDTYAKRQSSKPVALWVFNGQSIHRTATAATTFVVEADRAQFLVNNPDDASLRDAVNIAGTGDYFPVLMLRNDHAYYGGLQPRAVVEADFIHYPDMSRVLRDVYINRGMGDKVQTVAANGTNAFTDVVPWCQANV